jgi:hypothetical protein
MSRRLASAVALLAAGALAAPAQAKQISGLTACGADGCRPVERAIGQALHDLGGAPLATAPANAPHFRLVLKIGDGHRTFGTNRVLYVPSRRAVGGDGGWTRIDAGSARKLAHALAGRAPLPAAALTKDVAALDPPGTSLPPEVFIPAATSATKASSAGGTSWWLLGAAALAAAAALGFIGSSHLRRR